jgi:hypothetical protein
LDLAVKARPYLKKTKAKRDEGVSSGKRLPSKCKALNSNSLVHQKKKVKTSLGSKIKPRDAARGLWAQGRGHMEAASPP